jgi:hypothetical protein
MQEQMLEEMRRRMLRLKTSGTWKLTGARRTGERAFFGVLATGLLMTGATMSWAQATSSSSATQPTQNTVPIANTKIALAAPVTYDNKYEFYAGINFMNFQAGQNLPKRMNLGGGEFLATYWLPGDHWFTNHVGVGAEYRGEAGTTPVFGQAQGLPYNLSRPLVYMNIGMLGAQYRGPKNQYVAINYHAYGGVAHGTFDDDLRPGQPGQPTFSDQTDCGDRREYRHQPLKELGATVVAGPDSGALRE